MLKDQRDPKLSRRWMLRNKPRYYPARAERGWKEQYWQGEVVSWSVWFTRHLTKGKGVQTGYSGHACKVLFRLLI